MRVTLSGRAKALIHELRRIQRPGTFPQRDEHGRILLRGYIAANGGYLYLSREMERLIAGIARVLKKNDAHIDGTWTDAEWHATVRRVLGGILIGVDPNGDLSQSGKAILVALRRDLASSTMPKCEHAFGCTLFYNFQIPSFNVGPVTFEPRLEWLTRKAKEADISRITERRATAQWAGRRLQKRKRSTDSAAEDDILGSIGDCPYVCSVRTADLAGEAARLRAQTAARLAMTTIALCWNTTARTLEGFRLAIDGDVVVQRSLVFVAGKTFGGSAKKGRPHGPAVSTKEWLKLAADFRAEFEAAGEAIAYFTSATAASKRPDLMNALVHALLWFHEGCRDEVALMSVVKFSASMDALAGGGGVYNIQRLITARLGIQKDQIINEDGLTMGAAIERIYNETRSRTVHGTHKKISHDWSSTRALAEFFARSCLLKALEWSAQNPSSILPEKLQE